MESSDWIAVASLSIATVGLVWSATIAHRANGRSERSAKAAEDAVSKAGEANALSAKANTLAEREFARRTEQVAIDWRRRWDEATCTLELINEGDDPAHEVVLTVHKSAHLEAASFTVHEREGQVGPGRSIKIRPPLLPGHALPPRPLDDLGNLEVGGVSLQDVANGVARKHSYRSRSDAGFHTTEDVRLKLTKILYSIKWKTPAGNPKEHEFREMQVFWFQAN